MTVLAFALALVAPAEEETTPPVVNFACDDLVVIGKMTNTSDSLIEGPRDVLGHGYIRFNVHIRDRLAGKDDRKIVPAATVAHGYMNEDHEFLLVLRRVRGKQDYWLQDVRLWELAPETMIADMPAPPPRPQIAARCT